MPIALGTFVYMRAIHTINEEIKNVNAMALRQLQLVIDHNFDELERMASNLAISEDIRKLAALKSPPKSNDIITILKIQDSMSNFLLTNSSINDIYLYLNNQDFIVSSGYKYNYDELDEICQRKFGLSKDDLFLLSRSKDYCQFRVSSENQKTILYMCPMFIRSFHQPDGILIVTLKEEQVKELLTNFEISAQGQVLLVNPLNESYRTENRILENFTVDYSSIMQNDNYFSVDIGIEKAICSYIPSNKLDLAYISLIPTSVFHTKIYYIKKMIHYYILLCILIGVTAAILFARRSYNPIQKLKQLLVRNTKNEVEEKNEFQFLKNSLVKLLDEKSMIENRLKKQNIALRNNFISRILKGYAGNAEQIREGLESYRIRLSGSCCLVTAVCIEDVDESFIDGINDMGIDSMIYLIIQNVGEELLNEKYNAVAADVDGMIMFLITADLNMDQESLDTMQEDCAAIMDKAIQFIQEKFGMILYSCISNVHSGLSEVATAFSEVLQAVEYRDFVGRQDSVILYKNINSDDNERTFNAFCLEMQRQLGNCIIMGYYEQAKDLLNRILQNYYQNPASIQLMKYRGFTLLYTMLDATEKIREKGGAEFLEEYEPLPSLLSVSTFAELKMQMENILDLLIAYLNEMNCNKVPDWVDTVEEYIQSNYQDPALSVSSISENLNISMSYLSRSYKKFRGINLLDYIHKIRIEKAKLIINSTNLKDVAQQVGYYESKALIRVFKKYEGVTPGRFKKINS